MSQQGTPPRRFSSADYASQIDIDTPFLGVFPDLASAKEAMRQAVHYSANGWINLCAPSADLHFVPPFKALAISRIDPWDIELYPIVAEGDEDRGGGPRNAPLDPAKNYGIPKAMIDRVKQLRQISIAATRRVDDQLVDGLWRYECTVISPDLQGGLTQITKSREVDMRDGAPDLRKAAGKLQKEGAVRAARLNAPQMAESKAQNRAVAEALNMARGMKPPEFYRPWITVSLVPHAQVELMSQQARDAASLYIIGGAAAQLLYGGMPAQAAPAPAPTEPPNPAGQAGTPPSSGTPAADGQAAKPPPRNPSNETPGGAAAAPPARQPQGQQPAPAARPDQPKPADPPRNADGVELANEQQLASLTAHWKRLGKDVFSQRACEALGVQILPNGKAMTATQAGMLVQLFDADTAPKPAGDDGNPFA